jgi:hypothetical protein
LPLRAALHDGIPFGRSPAVVRSYSLYEMIVSELFETYKAPPLPLKSAVDTLIAAVHGIVAFQMHPRTMDWTDTLTMVETMIDAMLAAWHN